MPAIRTIVIADGERWLGTAQVPETTMLVKHDGALFFRSGVGVRLSGGGIGIVFSHVEPLVLDKLNQIYLSVNRSLRDG